MSVAPGPDEWLRELKDSGLFSPEVPNRARFSHAEWAGLDEEERRGAMQPRIDAVRRIRNHRELADLVRQIGAARHTPAVPMLADLWITCALDPVRVAVGHALRAIGSPEARSALVDLIEDSDSLSVYLAVRAIFDEDPRAAFERCAAYFDPRRLAQPGGQVIAREVLATFAPGALQCVAPGELKPLWNDARAPGWLRDDPRWLRLCVDLRRHKTLGRTARAVLQDADPGPVAIELAKAREREGPRVVHVMTVPAGDLAVRYRRGEFGAVWSELRSHAALGGDLLLEARAVALETMRRVAQGAALLAERLAARGWKSLYGRLHTFPQTGDEAVMRRIEEVTGASLPLGLRAFWEVVGGINFVWNYEGGDDVPDLGVRLPMEGMDPIAVDPPGEVVHVFDEWKNLRDGIDPELAGGFNLDLAPDYLHKVNISGGPPYGLELPFHGADPTFENEAHCLPFVEYLRLCFRWGGFPRLERHSERADVREFVSEITHGLEPF